MTHKDHKEGMEERFQMLKEKLIAVEQNEWWLSDEDFILAFIREEPSHQLTTIQEMIEGMYKVKQTDDLVETIYGGAYNKALDELLAKLKEIKQ